MNNSVSNRNRLEGNGKSAMTMAIVAICLAIFAALVYFVTAYALPICVAAVIAAIVCLLLIIVYVGWIILVLLIYIAFIMSPLLLPLIGTCSFIVEGSALIAAVAALILGIVAFVKVKKNRGIPKPVRIVSTVALVVSIVAISAILIGIVIDLVVGLGVTATVIMSILSYIIFMMPAA